MTSELPVASGCDAPEPRPIYVDRMECGEPVYRCRCIVCARCERHTGNNLLGHYTTCCQNRDVRQQVHFCCPGDCELDARYSALRPGPGQRALIPPVHPDLAPFVPPHLPTVGRPAAVDL